MSAAMGGGRNAKGKAKGTFKHTALTVRNDRLVMAMLKSSMLILSEDGCGQDG
jgi:hypothetical protein